MRTPLDGSSFRLQVSRRDFLKIAGLGIAAVAGPKAAAQPGPALVSYEVIRPRDLLKLTFEFRSSLRCDAEGRLHLSVANRFGPVRELIGLKFPPQHIAEESIEDRMVEAGDFPGLVPARSAGPSRLVFRLKSENNELEIPITLAELLELTRNLKINPAHQFKEKKASGVSGAYSPALPTVDESVIEFPYRLFIAPAPESRFFHCSVPYSRVQPIRGEKWTWIELWHSALDLRLPSARKLYFPPVFSVDATDTEETLEKIMEGPVSVHDDPRGIFLPTYVRPEYKGTTNLECDVPPLDSTVKEEDRWAPYLVAFEKLRDQSIGGDGVLRAKQLLLTSIGATADLDYRAEVNMPGDLRQWIHKTSIGRDYYVRTVTNGLLMPYFHPAVLVTIWERKLYSREIRGAIVKRRSFLLILDPVRPAPTSDETDNLAANAYCRGHVLKSVRIIEQRSPNLARGSNENNQEVEPNGRENFWPRINLGSRPQLLEFECEGTDIHGGRCAFRMPMFFVVKLEKGALQYRNSPEGNRTAVFNPCPAAFTAKSAAPLNAPDFTAHLSNFANQLLLSPLKLGDSYRSLLSDLAAQPGKTLGEQALSAARLNTIFDANELSLDGLVRPIKAATLEWLEVLHGVEAVEKLPQAIKDFADKAESFFKGLPEAIQKDPELVRLCGLVEKIKQRAAGPLPEPPPEKIAMVIAGAVEAFETFTAQILVALEKAMQSWVKDNIKIPDVFRANFSELVGAIGAAVAGQSELETFRRRAHGWADQRRGLGDLIENYLRDIRVTRPEDLPRILESFKALDPDFISNTITKLETGQVSTANVIALVRAEASRLVAGLDRIPHPGAIKASIIRSVLNDELAKELRPPDPAVILHRMVFQVNKAVDSLGSQGLSILERLGAAYEKAVIEVPSLKKIAPDMENVTIAPFQAYVEQGFARLRNGIIDGVQQGVYAALEKPLAGVGRQIEAAVMNPAMQFAGLSREIGAVIGNGEASLRDAAGVAKNDLEDLVNRFKALERGATDEFKEALEKRRQELEKLAEEKIDKAREDIQTALRQVGGSQLENLKKARAEFQYYAGQIHEAHQMVSSIAASLQPATLKAGLESYARKKLATAVKDLNVQQWLPEITLFGSVNLSKLLALITDAASLPKMVIENLPTQVITRWNWEQKLENAELGIVEFVAGSNCKVKLASVLTTYLPTLQQPRPAAPTVHVNGSLGEVFMVRLFKVLEIKMQSIAFESGTGRETRITPTGLDIQFMGPLAFVAKLQEKFKSFYQSKGLLIELDAASIRVGLQLQIPPISFGVFSLSNLSFGSSLALPLANGATTFRFAFCQPDKKALLSVAGFAGAAYLQLDIDTRSGCSVEGAFEFGGCIEFNIAVASGALYIMAGIYFRFTPRTKDLAGYLRAGGRLDVLGLITVSVELYLGLQYQTRGNESVLWGRAELKISIKIFFFKKTVTIGFEKTFAGSKRSNGQVSLRRRKDRLLADGIEAPGAAFEFNGDSAVVPETLANAAPRFTQVIDRRRFKRQMKTYRLQIKRALHD